MVEEINDARSQVQFAHSVSQYFRGSGRKIVSSRQTKTEGRQGEKEEGKLKRVKELG